MENAEAIAAQGIFFDASGLKLRWLKHPIFTEIRGPKMGSVSLEASDHLRWPAPYKLSPTPRLGNSPA